MKFIQMGTDSMDLSDLKAKDLMSTEPLAVHPSEQIAAVDLLMSRNKLGGIPVIDNGKLVGLITMRDIMLSRFSLCVDGMKVEDLMRRNPAQLSPESSLKEVLDIIVNQQIDQIPVIEDGEIVGLIYSENLLKKLVDYI